MSTLYVILQEGENSDSTQIHGKALVAMNYVYLGRWMIREGMDEDEVARKISETVNYMCALDERVACGFDRHTLELVKPYINKDVDLKLLVLR